MPGIVARMCYTEQNQHPLHEQRANHMALHFADNRYPGVNAHLNSYLQQPNGMWTSFHNDLVGVLKRTLNASLPEPYYAITEQGLQISTIGLDDIEARGTRPDVAILRSSLRGHPTGTAQGSAPLQTMPLTETISLAEEDILLRVSVYHAEEDDARGQLVTVLEVLSPGNKPGGGNSLAYQRKRVDLLRAGINLIEIDLLHEIRPVLNTIPGYAAGEPDARPYNITLSIPKPSLDAGEFRWYGATVAEPLPTIAVPLLQDDEIALNLQESYNAAFLDTPLYPRLVDYETLPVNFERYRAADQQTIRALLQTLRVQS